MNALVYVAALAAGVWLLVDIYIFKFDQHSEKELIRLSFYWAPLILFGLLGSVALATKKVSNPLLFAIVGTLLGTVGLAAFIMLVFLS
jgi:hypothetical protein